MSHRCEVALAVLADAMGYFARLHPARILPRGRLQNRWRTRSCKLLSNLGLGGARWWIRTTDPRRVKAVLYR